MERITVSVPFALEKLPPSASPYVRFVVPVAVVSTNPYLKVIPGGTLAVVAVTKYFVVEPSACVPVKKVRQFVFGGGELDRLETFIVMTSCPLPAGYCSAMEIDRRS